MTLQKHFIFGVNDRFAYKLFGYSGTNVGGRRLCTGRNGWISIRTGGSLLLYALGSNVGCLNFDRAQRVCLETLFLEALNRVFRVWWGIAKDYRALTTLLRLDKLVDVVASYLPIIF